MKVNKRIPRRLSHLLDVDTGARGDGKTLVYDQASEKHIYSTPPAGGSPEFGLPVTSGSGALSITFGADFARRLELTGNATLSILDLPEPGTVLARRLYVVTRGHTLIGTNLVLPALAADTINVLNVTIRYEGGVPRIETALVGAESLSGLGALAVSFPLAVDVASYGSAFSFPLTLEGGAALKGPPDYGVTVSAGRVFRNEGLVAAGDAPLTLYAAITTPSALPAADEPLLRLFNSGGTGEISILRLAAGGLRLHLVNDAGTATSATIAEANLAKGIAPIKLVTEAVNKRLYLRQFTADLAAGSTVSAVFTGALTLNRFEAKSRDVYAMVAYRSEIASGSAEESAALSYLRDFRKAPLGSSGGGAFVPAPTLDALTPGDSKAVVTYTRGTDPIIAGSQYSIDGGTWETLGPSPATIQGLVNGVQVNVAIRNIDSASNPSAQASGNVTPTAVALFLTNSATWADVPAAHQNIVTKLQAMGLTVQLVAAASSGDNAGLTDTTGKALIVYAGNGSFVTANLFAANVDVPILLLHEGPALRHGFVLNTTVNSVATRSVSSVSGNVYAWQAGIDADLFDIPSPAQVQVLNASANMVRLLAEDIHANIVRYAQWDISTSGYVSAALAPANVANHAGTPPKPRILFPVGRSGDTGWTAAADAALAQAVAILRGLA